MWVEGKTDIVCVKLDSLSNPQVLSSTTCMGRCARGPRKFCFKPSSECTAAGHAKPKAPAARSAEPGPDDLYLFLRVMETQNPSDRFAYNHPYVPLCLLKPLKSKLQEARMDLGS